MKKIGIIGCFCILLLGCYRNTEVLASDTYEWDKFYQRVPTPKKEIAFSLSPNQVLEIYWQNLETGETTRLNLQEDQTVKIQANDGSGSPQEETSEVLPLENYQKILQKLQQESWLHLETEYSKESQEGFNLIITFWKDLKNRQETKTICCRSSFQPELFALLEDFSPVFKEKLPYYEGMLALLQAQKK